MLRADAEVLAQRPERRNRTKTWKQKLLDAQASERSVCLIALSSMVASSDSVEL